MGLIVAKTFFEAVPKVSLNIISTETQCSAESKIMIRFSVYYKTVKVTRYILNFIVIYFYFLAFSAIIY